jgi:hypothetical protein
MAIRHEFNHGKIETGHRRRAGVHHLRGTSECWQTSDIAADHKRPYAITAFTQTQRGMTSRIHVLRRLVEHGAASSCTLNEAMN